MKKRLHEISLATWFAIAVVIGLAMGSVVIVWAVDNNMRRQALVEAEFKARMLLDRNLATHTYFSHDLKPQVFELVDPLDSNMYFDPVWMSSTYAVRQMDAYFKELSDSDYYYKEAAINARSPGNEADDYERLFIERLNQDPAVVSSSEIRSIDGKPYFTVLRRGEVMEESCLRCHSDPSEAPGGLVATYGSARSFNRQLGEVVSAVSIRIPLAAAYAETSRFSWQLSEILFGGLAALFAVQFVISSRLVFRPLSLLRDKELQIANHREHLGEHVPVGGGKELRELSQAFNVMSSKLREGRDNLERTVNERTADLKQANEQLRISQERYAMATSVAQIGVWDWNLETNELYVDPVLKNLLGYEDDEIRNHLDDWGRRGHPDDLGRIMRATEAHIRGVTPNYEVISRMIHKDGSIRWFVSRGTVMRDADGNPCRLIGTDTDITEQRKLEEQFIQSQKMDIVGQLAGGIAHQFNNLLTSVLGYADFVKQSLPVGDPSRADIDVILDNSSRLAELTGRLLAFAQRQIIQPEYLDLNWVVSDAEGLVSGFSGPEIRSVKEFAPDLGVVRADPRLLEQALINVIVNARDAMPDGGSLTLQTANVSVQLETAQEHPGVLIGDYVMVAVCDTGVGMSEEVKKHLFEPFFTTKGPAAGVGLGLAAAYGIIQQHHGHITVESEMGKGTQVRIYLPRHRCRPEDEPSRIE